MRTIILRLKLFCSFVIICACCGHKKDQVNGGLVILRSSFFNRADDSLRNPLFVRDFKIWYHDRFAIEQVTRIHFEQNNGIKTRTDIVLGYIFIDPQTKSYYCYKTFSDTATLLQRAKSLDSIRADGGWDFYNLKPTKYTGTPAPMSDTIIAGVTFRRLTYHQSLSDEGPTETTAFFRCDRKGRLFDKDTSLSKLMNGCPLTRTTQVPLDSLKSISQSEFIFASDTLTQQERKVFETWKENALKRPVNGE